MTKPNAAGSVRRLREDDFERWLSLWDGYVSFYRTELSTDLTRLTFERLRDGVAGMLGLVAVDSEDSPVGLANLVFHSGTWSASSRCYLEDLYVGPSARGSGTGRALIEATYAQARANGADSVYWHTQSFNGAARSLYDTVAQLTSYVVYEHDILAGG